MPDLSLYIEDVSNSVNYAIEAGEKVLVEGTQGTYLSLFHGGYPYVTSRDVTASGICSDIGIGPKRVDDVLVVFKAYVTRVGGGPLENELSEDEAKKRGWLEFGSVTGRQRRAAPFDFALAKKAVRLNSATQLAVTKLDVMFPECARVRDWSKMPADARKFVEEIEGELGVKVALVGTGPDLDDIVDRR
jgi:adenylosuccinate synthase